MDIYIKWNNDADGFRLPILPSSFEQGLSQQNQSLNIHNRGEINLKGKRALKTISFSSFFPCQNYQFCRCKPKAPYDYYCKTLEKLMIDNITVHLIITGTDINFFATIESFAHGESERVRDVTYSIEFKEYVDVKTKTTRLTKSKKTGGYKWKKGDTWPKVCKKQLGTSKNYKKIRKNNMSVIKKAKKKHPKKKEKNALIGYTVMLS